MHNYYTRYAKRQKLIIDDFNEWIYRVDKAISARFGTVRTSDFLDFSSEQYRDMFNMHCDCDDVAVEISNSNYTYWKNSIKTKVFESLKVFIDDLPDKNYRTMFNNCTNCYDLADTIIKDHSNDDFTKWMQKLDVIISEDGHFSLKNADGLNYSALYTNGYTSKDIANMIDNCAFDVWMSSIDKLVFSSIGMHFFELPDEDFRTMWDNHKKPNEVAQFIVRNYLDMESYFKNLK